MNTAHTLLRSWRFHAPGPTWLPSADARRYTTAAPVVVSFVPTNMAILSAALATPQYYHHVAKFDRKSLSALPFTWGCLRQQAAVFQPHMRPSACTVEIHTAHFAHRPPRDRHLATELPHVSHRDGTVDTEPEKPPSRLRTSEALKYAPVRIQRPCHGHRASQCAGEVCPTA